MGNLLCKHSEHDDSNVTIQNVENGNSTEVQSKDEQNLEKHLKRIQTLIKFAWSSEEQKSFSVSGVTITFVITERVTLFSVLKIFNILMLLK